MRTRIMLLLALTLFLLAVPRHAQGATLSWTNALPSGSGVTDLMPDGKGGILICFTNDIGARVRYVDKKGVQVADWSFSAGTEVYVDYVTPKEAIAVGRSYGRYWAYRLDLKNSGNSSGVASSAGSDYMFGPTVPTANKDAKGFFLVRRVVATGACIIERYSYK